MEIEGPFERFRGFLAETYDSVCKRSELNAVPLDLVVLKHNLAEWIRPEGDPDG